MKTTTIWQNGHVFESFQETHRIVVDGNKGNGFSPKALLLSGLAACSGIDLVDILTKMRVEFSGLSIEVSAEQTDTHPRVFKDIEMIFSLKTARENEDKLKKAIDLSLVNYCGVAAMLKKNSEIHYKILIL